MAGGKGPSLPMPRKEAAENELAVHNEQFLELGLHPISIFQKGLFA